MQQIKYFSILITSQLESKFKERLGDFQVAIVSVSSWKKILQMTSSGLIWMIELYLYLM